MLDWAGSAETFVGAAHKASAALPAASLHTGAAVHGWQSASRGCCHAHGSLIVWTPWVPAFCEGGWEGCERPGKGADLAISCPSQGAGRFHPPLHHLVPSAQSYLFSSAQSYETFWRAAPAKLLFACSHQLAWACCSVLQRHSQRCLLGLCMAAQTHCGLLLLTTGWRTVLAVICHAFARFVRPCAAVSSGAFLQPVRW